MNAHKLSVEISPDCFVGATHDVGEAHKLVRWMLRLLPPTSADICGLGEMQMSGWLFMTGEEDEYTEETGIYYLKDILKHNPDIAPYLATTAPCRLERDGDLPVFLDVSDEYPEIE